MLILASLPMAVAAEDPLSAIGWLRRNPPPVVPAARPLAEPPVSSGVTAPEVTVTTLDAVPVAIGLVPQTVTGLPVTLWRGSDTDTLTQLIAEVPVRNNPAMQSLLYTLLLAEGLPPSDDDGELALTLAQIDRLIADGAIEPAEALARKSGPTRSAALFQRWFDATLLTGTEAAACAVLAASPYLAPGYGARIFCAARRGDWPAAALMLDTARTLGELTDDEAWLLDRFLNPEIDDLLPPRVPAGDPDVLTFRLYQAIGEPLPAGSLPRAFAYADLSDLAGWKAQVEAAERLARIGALGPNRYLGIFTARSPAASGGVWDRVDALQRFETALASGTPDEVADRLGPAWAAMRAAGTEITFAQLFGDRLAGRSFDDPDTARLAWRIRLLSDGYESAARSAPDDPDSAFLAGLAMGHPPDRTGTTGLRGAIAAGFADTARPPADLDRILQRGALGEAILRAIALFQQGADGNPSALSDAIATLRAVGLEDTARKASLQLILLESRR